MARTASQVAAPVPVPAALLGDYPPRPSGMERTAALSKLAHGGTCPVCHGQDTLSVQASAECMDCEAVYPVGAKPTSVPKRYSSRTAPAPEVRKMASVDDDYRLQHTAPGPDSGAPLHDLTSEHHGVYPKDFHEHPEWYTSDAHPEAMRSVMRTKGRPNAPVNIYRALPKGHTTINQGDWVTTSAEYARQHGMHHEDESKDMPVLKATVPAHHLWTNGDSLNEYGYHGPTIENAQTHFSGGKNAVKRSRRGR